MTVVKLKVDPTQTPEEEAQLVARIARAVAEDTGDETVQVELTRSEQVSVPGPVGERMSMGSRWGG